MLARSFKTCLFYNGETSYFREMVWDQRLLFALQFARNCSNFNTCCGCTVILTSSIHAHHQLSFMTPLSDRYNCFKIRKEKRYTMLWGKKKCKSSCCR